MVNEDLIIPKENIYKTEEIREIKTEILSFEEFMKTYELNEEVERSYLNEVDSYDELGIEKGYGPCHSCGNKDLRFRLEIVLKNVVGGGMEGTVFSTEQAEIAAREIRNKTGHWSDSYMRGTFSQSNRQQLANEIISWVDIHKNGSNVDRKVSAGGW